MVSNLKMTFNLWQKVNVRNVCSPYKHSKKVQNIANTYLKNKTDIILKLTRQVSALYYWFEICYVTRHHHRTRVGEETNHAPQKHAMRGSPRRYIKTTCSLGRPRPWAAVWSDQQDFYKKTWQSRLLKSLTSWSCLSRDEDVDELGDGLENLEINVEFVSYARSWNFQENLKAWESELLPVSSLVYKLFHAWTCSW